MFAAVISLTADTTSADPTGGFLSYGVLGIVVVALMTGLLVPGYLYKKTEAENDRLRRLIDEKVYPTIEASTQSTKDAAETMRTVIQVLASDRPPAPRPRAPRKQ
jgi:hypothetical protein